MSGPNSRSHLPIPSTQHRSFCTVREGEGLEVGRWNNGTCSRNMMQQCQAVWNGWSICQHQLLLDIWHLEISGNVFDIHSYWGTNMQTWFHGLPQLFFPSKTVPVFQLSELRSAKDVPVIYILLPDPASWIAQTFSILGFIGSILLQQGFLLLLHNHPLNILQVGRDSQLLSPEKLEKSQG